MKTLMVVLLSIVCTTSQSQHNLHTKAGITGLSGELQIILVAILLLGTLYWKLVATKKKLNKAQSDRDVLLKEIHHRVKNNLQVISSLLSLQSKHIKDENALDAINSGKSRVQSMSLLHQDLYKEDNLKGVNMKVYFNNLCENLFDTYKLNEDQITFTSNIEALELDIDTVIPIGLITNELITNSIKHAFPDGALGNIHLVFRQMDGALELTVKDNGIGLTSNKLPTKFDSLGTKLIHSFAEKLKASLEINTEAGTEVKLVIKNYKLAA